MQQHYNPSRAAAIEPWSYSNNTTLVMQQQYNPSHAAALQP